MSRSLWIKICGMTTPEAVAAALDARVDAIGFVFSPSSRRVTPAQAAALARPARGRARCIAVAKNATRAEIDAVLAGFAPDTLQIDATELAALDLPRELEVLPVVRSGSVEPQDLPPRFLFEGPVSGSGEPCDWTHARRLAQARELVLAGGLNPANVGVAIRTVAPFGVDVSSGVEDSPGHKSPLKIARFVEAARQEMTG